MVQEINKNQTKWGFSKKTNVAIAAVAGMSTLGSGSTAANIKLLALLCVAGVAVLSLIIQGLIDYKQIGKESAR